MIAIGIDPGATTGWALVEEGPGGKIIAQDYGKVRLKNHDWVGSTRYNPKWFDPGE
jgi:Holliday junction resolvasome RuvABC endonuclease subunit